MLRRNRLIMLAAGCLLAAATAVVAEDGDEPQTYTLTYKAETGGTLEISDDDAEKFDTASYAVTVVNDEPPPKITVKAIPQTGYNFVGWDDGYEPSVREVETDAGAAAGDATFTANFVKTHTLTYTAEPNGKIQAGENADPRDSYTATVNHGSSGPTVTAVPEYGYHFLSWSDGGTDSVHTVESVTSDTAFTAAFEINMYTLTYTAESGGKLQVNGSNVETYPVSLKHGSIGPNITAVPDNGYRFIGWSDDVVTTSRRDAAFSHKSITAKFIVIATIKIGSFEDLTKIGRYLTHPLNGSYELTADIDASASRNLNGGFKPIGSVYFYTSVMQHDSAFTGKFYGNGKTIKGLYINRPASDSGTGLFGYARNAEIRDVAVVEAAVTGGDYVGALAGMISGKTTIEGGYTSGSVKGDSIVGGLTGAVVDTGEGMVRGSYTSAAVSGKTVLGGLVGRNGRKARITGCYSSGTVTGSGNIVGGLVGYNANEIENSYSTAEVHGNGKVGGFVGESFWENPPQGGSGNTITQCYSTGAVSGGVSSVGGFAGNNDVSSTLRYCYWDRGASGQASAGTGAAGATGKTTAEMSAAAILAGLNYFSEKGNYWDISNSYPYLIGLPTDTATVTAVTLGSGIPAGKVSGKSEIAQIVNRGVNGAPAIASLVSLVLYRDNGNLDTVQVGDSLVGWYLAGANGKIANGVNAGFNAKVSGDTLALSKLGGNVEIEARFALKKYTVTYISRIRVDGSNKDRFGGKVEVKKGGNAVETADSVSVTMEYGTAITAKAVPDTGYRFRRWGSNPDDSGAVRDDTVRGAATFYAVFAPGVSVLTPDRKIPQIKTVEEAAVIPPLHITAGEFTVGPNPASRQYGAIYFYRQGKQIASCELRVYDASGNVIRKISIKDNAVNNYSKRKVGSWDLKDRKGRQVSEGTYLLKGIIPTRSGDKEKVSIIVSVR